jgi:intracellular septation protein A
MNYSAVLIGIVPLLVFVIVDAFAGLKTALISTVVMALFEALFSLYYFKSIDSVTIFSLITVVIFCFISFKKKSALFIKLQPVFLSLIIGVVLIVSYLLNEPLMLKLATKYKDLYPEQFQAQLNAPRFLKSLEISTLSMGIGLFAHAAATAFAAFKLSNWWWLAVRGIGFYLFMAGALICQRFFIHI